MSFEPIHYTRVAYEQLWKPRLWRLLVAPRLRSPFSKTADADFTLTDAALRNAYTKLQPRLLLDVTAETMPAHRAALRSISHDEELFNQAHAAIAHTFTLLGAPVLNAPQQHSPNWHTDFRSGYSWEAQKHTPSHDINVLTSIEGSDVKYPWELSRFQWLAWLGMAYILDDETTRELWYQAFERDVSNWIDENPVGCGINWTVSMEAALRAVSWIQAYSVFFPTTQHRSAFWQKFMDTLWKHGTFISYNLEYTRHPGNHFDANALGLVALGSFFYDVKDGKRWFHAGKRALEREIFRQTMSDGVDWEKSTAYHRLVTEIFFAASVIADKAGMPFSSEYKERLAAMHEFMAAYCRADGSAPQFGDADDGRVVRSLAAETFTNHASHLVCGALYFQRADNMPNDIPDYMPDYTQNYTQNYVPEYLSRASSRASSWAASDAPAALLPLLDAWMWFGHNALERWKELQSSRLGQVREESALLYTHCKEGGYVVCRMNTGSEAHPVQAHWMADVGDYGMNGWGGHGHNDCLSFELWLGSQTASGVQGRVFVCDSGTGLYTADTALRDSLRSVEAHNTLVLTLNDKTLEPVEFAGLWRIHADNLNPHVESHAEDIEAELGGGIIRTIEAVQHGYEARYGVRHQRTFELETGKEGGTLEIADALLLVRDEVRKLFSQGDLQAYIHLHIPPGLSVEFVDAYTIVLRSNDVECTIHTSQELFVERCVYSPSYGVVQSAMRVRCACFLQVPTVTTLQWRYLLPDQRPQDV